MLPLSGPGRGFRRGRPSATPSSHGWLPAAEGFNRPRTFDGLAPASSRRDRLGPTRRPETGRQIGQWSEDEEPFPGGGVRHLEQLDAGTAGVIGSGTWGARAPDAVAAEDEQVEIDLAGAPALTGFPAERLLERLERHEQRQCAGLGIGAGRHVKRGHGVQKVGLLGDTDRAGSIEPGDATQPHPGERRQGMDGSCKGALRFTHVRSQSDIGTNALHGGESGQNGETPTIKPFPSSTNACRGRARRQRPIEPRGRIRPPFVSEARRPPWRPLVRPGVVADDKSDQARSRTTRVRSRWGAAPPRWPGAGVRSLDAATAEPLGLPGRHARCARMAVRAATARSGFPGRPGLHVVVSERLV